MSTPHNRAEKGDIAKIVLMPGDPIRAKWIADTYLDEVKLVSDVRNVYCYTGLYKGKFVSVMASGMGMPSMGIYSYELYKFYDVEAIIRIGSAGAYTTDLHVLDVVLADKVWSESTYAKSQSGDVSEWQYPSQKLNQHILEMAKSLEKPVIKTKIHSSDVFYHEANVNEILWENVHKENLSCVEMESFALFHNASVLGKEAACLLTISDSLVVDAALSADERATAFSEMVELALESAVSYEKNR